MNPSELLNAIFRRWLLSIDREALKSQQALNYLGARSKNLQRPVPMIISVV